ncbi:MAG TPA: hypothetical protein PKH07_19235, partial [bacterium]|nr:hypothetical protein [bacterium]
MTGKKAFCFAVFVGVLWVGMCHAEKIELIKRPEPTEASLGNLLPEDAQEAASSSALESILRRAQNAQTNRSYEEAIQLYQQAEKMPGFEESPQKIPARISMAEALESVGAFEESLKCYQQVLAAIAKSESPSDKRLRNSLLMRMARVYTLTGNQMKSRDVYFQLIQSLEGQERTQA